MFPYDSLREYAQALEARGKLKRIKEMDQDSYEMTAFAYRLRDRMHEQAPGFLVERTKIGGRWYDSPVIGNIFNGFGMVAQAFGAAEFDGENSSMHAAAVQRILSFMDKDFRWRKIEPVTVEKSAAPCKEVVLMGDQADLGLFPWIRNNPSDAGQYISASEKRPRQRPTGQVRIGGVVGKQERLPGDQADVRDGDDISGRVELCSA